MNIVIAGGSGGIGQALVRELAARPAVRRIDASYNRNRPRMTHPALTWHQVDLTSAAAVREWSAQLQDIDWLINAAGLLHRDGQGPEKTIKRFDPEFFMASMQTNAMPSMLLASYLGSHFRHGRPALFATISAKVGSIEDNRLGGWYSYRASKAALNMCMKTLAIEWRRSLPNVTVAVLHPGTTDTPLSEPFQRNVPPGQLFSPEQSAGYMLEVLDRLTPADSGRFWAFDGEELPW